MLRCAAVIPVLVGEGLYYFFGSLLLLILVGFNERIK
jgi:hypothetical protein